MKPAFIIAGVAAVTVTAALLLTRKGAPPPVASAAPPADTAVGNAGIVAPPAAPPAAAGGPSLNLGNFTKGGGGILGTVVAGIKASNAVGNVVEKVGGQGMGDLARINVSLAPTLLTKVATEKALAFVGAPPSVAKHAAITAGAYALVGIPGAIAKGTFEGVSLGIRAVAGKGAEKAVRGAVRQFDPTLKGSIANDVVVKPVAKIIKGLGKLF